MASDKGNSDAALRVALRQLLTLVTAQIQTNDILSKQLSDEQAKTSNLRIELDDKERKITDLNKQVVDLQAQPPSTGDDAAIDAIVSTSHNSLLKKLSS